jgi:hypothetical protein
VVRPILLALSFTVGAELIYFFVWGIALFPDGDILAKLVWTLTCGIGIAGVIGSATIFVVVGRYYGWRAICLASLIVITVGTVCSILCSQLDQTFGYFGGTEHRALFLSAGIIPSIFGGFAYGWLLFSDRGRDLLSRF